jgi:hypothetical protein
MEFYLFWGLCLAVMVGFGVICGIFELKQRKADRQRKQEAEERRLKYLEKREKKVLWESNAREYADLFEGSAEK